jgi:hypothetical protein
MNFDKVSLAENAKSAKATFPRGFPYLVPRHFFFALQRRNILFS